ncbi:MAG TPA: helix-turn-helix domain-containing protein [Chthoniobacterales bacterium]
MGRQLQADLSWRLGKRFVTIDEFAAVTGVSKPTIYEKMRRGEIPYDDSSGRRRVPVSFIDQMERNAFANAKRAGASAC